MIAKISFMRNVAANPIARTMIIFIVIVICGFGMSRGQSMSPVWLGPYLSAAANLEIGGEFLVDIDEVMHFKELDKKGLARYSFSKSPDVELYNSNPIGFSYIVAFAKFVFPFLGDIQAVVALQVIVHALIATLVILSLGGFTSRMLFFLVYAVNPVILYIVGVPYYYFWQVVPATGIVVLLMHDGSFSRQGAMGVVKITALCLLGAAVGLVLVTRPTTIGVAVMFLVMLLFSKSIGMLAKTAVIGIALVAAATVYQPSEKNVWHTIYVGIGAYDNQFVDGLSDNRGYELFESKTGTPLNASIGGNYYESETIQTYAELAEEEVLRIAKQQPALLVKNAVVNTSMAFGPGYVAGASDWLNYAMAFAGLVMLSLMLSTGQYLLVVAVILSSAAFTLYYPPIPAYMFGNYLLLCFGFVRIVEFFIVGSEVDWRNRNA